MTMTSWSALLFTQSLWAERYFARLGLFLGVVANLVLLLPFLVLLDDCVPHARSLPEHNVEHCRADPKNDVEPHEAIHEVVALLAATTDVPHRGDIGRVERCAAHLIPM